MVQPIVPPVNTSMAVIFCERSSSGTVLVNTCSANSIMTPAKPKSKPSMVGILEKFSFHLGLSNIINQIAVAADRKSTRLNSSHVKISYAVFCLKKKKKHKTYV